MHLCSTAMDVHYPALTCACLLAGSIGRDQGTPLGFMFTLITKVRLKYPFGSVVIQRYHVLIRNISTFRLKVL